MGDGIPKVTVKKILQELVEIKDHLSQFVRAVKSWEAEDKRQHNQRLPEYRKSVIELRELNRKMDSLLEIMRTR